MKNKRKPHNYWTVERVKREALKYKNRSDFRIKSASAYNKARKLEILDKICNHMEVKGNKFKRMLYAFEFPDKSVYVGLTFDYKQRYKSHMRNNFLIIDKTDNLGHEFIMFNELYSIDVIGEKEKDLIQSYKNKGWDILNKNKAGALGSNTRKWTKEKILKESLKFNKKKDLFRKKPGLIKAAKKLGVWKEATSHMKIERKLKWTKEEIFNKSDKYSDFKKFREEFGGAYNAAKKLGIIEDIKDKFNLNQEKWTHKKVKKLAKKYNLISKFEREYSGAVRYARRNNIINEIKNGMITGRRLTWTKKDLIKEAKKYKKRNHFRVEAGGAYNAAKRLGIFDKICSHMPKRAQKSKK